VKTDTIANVTPKGIQLNSGEFLNADMIVPATGLRLRIAGGASVTVDGVPVQVSEKYIWHGMMLQDIPNAGFIIGYTNASWTLGADATALTLCRLLKDLEKRRYSAVVPRLSPAMAVNIQPRRLLNLSSTYVTKAEKDLPKAADRGPWVPRDNYLSDLWFAKYGNLEEGMEYLGEKKTQ
jgi:cation diffusion facilitator CzcD-associated flavoprotein CzcO